MKNISSILKPALTGALLALITVAQAQTPLADKPINTSAAVAGNVVLALSVEFPTVVSVAHQGKFVPGTSYLGYFDPKKCYRYQQGTESGSDLSHFFPVGNATSDFKCTGSMGDAWSGSFINWLTMQAIDPFRWALTGGYRVVDTATTTILERAWSTSAPDQGGDTNFPLIPTTNSNPLKARPTPTATEITEHTPLSFTSLRVSVRTRGNQVWFTQSAALTTGTSGSPTHYSQGSTPATNALHFFYARVKVCDASWLETNCKAYGSNYKPEGLMQQYSEKMRFSAFGYLNDPTDNNRDGGVLRARQKFVGVNVSNPTSAPTVNPAAEWDKNTGVMFVNPDTADATQTNSTFGLTGADQVLDSGVMNYLNKFGQKYKTSKRRDPVSELYYGTLRYLKKQGHVPAWSNINADPNKARLIDGFPVIQFSSSVAADDPIQYWCQKNFILGIGDTNTNWDWNVPGSSGGSNEPTDPPQLAADSTLNAKTATDRVGGLQNGSLTSSLGSSGISNGSYLIAGMAFDANTKDMRPDLTAPVVPQPPVRKVTAQTYWLDVLEFGDYVPTNQYYLAAKFGGFDVAKLPSTFNLSTATSIPENTWYKGTRLSSTGQKLPDNYFTVAKPDDMVAGLTAAFNKIAEEIDATTTASATALPQVASAGDVNYSANFDARTWTSDVQARSIVFSGTSTTNVLRWSFADKLADQLAGSGWNTGRRMATWNGTQGVPFRYTATPSATTITAAQRDALDTPWGNTLAQQALVDGQEFLNYMRGDRTNETTPFAYRARVPVDSAAAVIKPNFVSDIVGSKLTVVGRPAATLQDEPGYTAFRAAWAPSVTLPTGRRTVVYAGTNGGVLHAINGAPFSSAQPAPAAGSPLEEWDANAGKEIFAYVPSALFSGPTLPKDDGLAALGNPDYVHKYFVNATPKQFDIDLANTVAGKANDATCLAATAGPNWRTLLIGGLGKGGKSYYALDVTDPTSITSESDLATKVVRWEFPRAGDPKDPALANKVGFSFGEPVVVRTKAHGWVVILTSGYNNTDGKSYFFIVDPCTGFLVSPPIQTDPTVASTGMAHATAYVLAIGSGLADAAYAGDLSGNVWRLNLLDLDSSGNYTTPQRIAKLTSNGTTPQPVTVRPLIEYDPKTLSRFVMVGTGRLLHKDDLSDSQKQSFYAFRDGTVRRFSLTALGTGGPDNHLQRTDLIDISGSLTTGGLFNTTQKGWYLDLGRTGVGGATYPGTGWRMVDNAAGLPTTGRVALAALRPNASSDICLPTAESILYGLNFGAGGSFLKDSAGAVTGSIAVADRILDLRFFSDGKGSSKLIYGNEKTGALSYPPVDPLPAPTWRRLNWREIQLAK